MHMTTIVDCELPCHRPIFKNLQRIQTRVQFIKYHEAVDQQPLSKKAAEKLGIFPSLALSSLAVWVRQNGFDVDLIDLHVENIYPQDAAGRVQDYDPHIVALTAKTLGWPAEIEIAQMVRQAAPKAIVVVGGPQVVDLSRGVAVVGLL